LIAFLLFSCNSGNNVVSEEWTPAILHSTNESNVWLPDYSYAGYHFGEKEIPNADQGTIFNVTDFGAVPGDNLDDSEAIMAALKASSEIQEHARITFPAGRFIIKKPVYIERNNVVLSGAGSGENGTVLYFPIPMKDLPVPEALYELKKYLVDYNKTQKTNDLGEKIDPLPFSLYSWSGGFLWFRVPGVRVKRYLSDFDVPQEVLAKLVSGKRGEHELEAALPLTVSEGEIVEIQWYNTEGEHSSLLKHIYLDTGAVNIGSNHWNNPESPLVTQQVQIVEIKGNKIKIKTPLMLDIRPEWKTAMVAWEHLEEVGIEGFRMEFPLTPGKPHHVEDGYNAIYFTRIFNGWAKDIVFHNADNGILTEEACNMTIQDITTQGERLAHYSVVVSGSHNILVKDLKVYNPVRHALSFNTLATRSVYLDCSIYTQPMLDQHSGLNHQNLFDHILLVDSTITKENNKFMPFTEGGAAYWKPASASYSTFWNIEMHFLNTGDFQDTIDIFPVTESPYANLIGIYGNVPLKLNYGPHAYIEGINMPDMTIESLYRHQLNERTKR
jgi:hypothetical protein